MCQLEPSRGRQEAVESSRRIGHNERACGFLFSAITTALRLRFDGYIEGQAAFCSRDREFG